MQLGYLRPLGEGTYGNVYLATCAEYPFRCALKRMVVGRYEAKTEPASRQLCADEVMMETVMREVDALRTLRGCAHVILLRKCYSDDDGDKYYANLVMELGECNLVQYLPHIDKPSDVLRVFRQVLTGVAHVHARGYMHRDLKCENVIMVRGEACVGDFGLAVKCAPGRTQTLPVCSLGYRAWEVHCGRADYGQAVDMWSLGIMLLNLLRKRAHFVYDRMCTYLERACQGQKVEEMIADANVCTFLRQYFQDSNAQVWADMHDHVHTVSLVMDKLLVFDDTKRISAEEALRVEWI